MLRSRASHVNLNVRVFELSLQRLIVVTGKGGVGKSSISAAMALQYARSGLQTLVCEVNTQERISRLLGHSPAGPDVTLLEENLWAVDVRPEEAMREYALMVLKFEAIYSAVFENRLGRAFLRFIPSLQELVLLGKILYHLKERRADGSMRFDKVIVDAPATGHAITFLSVPQVLLNTVPPGAMAKEAKWMRDLLIDPKTTAVVLVSLPEDLPVSETIELHQALVDQVKLNTALVVLNAFVETRFSADEVHALKTNPLRSLVDTHVARAERSLQSFHRLSSMNLPIVKVPRLFVSEFDRRAILEIGRVLTSQRGAP